MTNKKITLREKELRGLLEAEHARGYKLGVDCGQSIQRSVDDPLLAELRDKRIRVKTLEVLLDGLAPAAIALARIAKGD